MNAHQTDVTRIGKSPLDARTLALTGGKHLALIAPLLAKSAAGLSSYVSDLVPRLCDVGYRVTVLSTDCAYRGAAAGELINIDSRADFKVFPVTGRFNRRVCRSPEMVQWFQDNCEYFDTVDIQGIWNWVTADIARVCKDANLPFVITPHGMMARWDWAKRPLAKRIFFQAKYQECWRSAAAVRFLSAGELENCMIRPQTPVAVIPNAISLHGKRDSEFIACFKASLNISQTAPLVLFLGRVTPQKGVLELVQAFDLVRRQCPEAVLAVAGWMGGSYGEDVRACAKNGNSRESIHFLGPVHGTIKDGLLASASAFVTLSRNEGLPLAVLEALGHGIPTVLTADSNVPEVSEYAAGFITELDPARAAGAIAEVLLDERRRAVMAENARRLAIERFSWNVALPQLTGLYEKIANR